MANKRVFVFIWLGCLFGSWLVIPYILSLGIVPSSISVIRLFFANTIQTSILYGISVSSSYLLLPKTDLKPLSNYSLKIFKPALFFGIFVGLIIWSLNKTIFKSSGLSSFHPPAWKGFLASFYGGINEEVLLRLFLFTFVYFLLGKMVKNRSYLFWSTNIAVALAFGIGHLPTAFKMVPATIYETSRVLILNGIPGLFFGWLYWSQGLLSAVIAHFAADLVLHVFL